MVISCGSLEADIRTLSFTLNDKGSDWRIGGKEVT